LVPEYLTLVLTKVVDLDGRFEYSKVISINNGAYHTKEHEVKVYPNPARNELNVGIELAQASNEIQVNLHDNLGRLISDNLIYDLEVDKGYKLYNVDITSVPHGVYSLEIVIDNTVIVRKVAITE